MVALSNFFFKQQDLEIYRGVEIEINTSYTLSFNVH